MHIPSWFIVLSLAATPTVAFAATFYVSPDGNDQATGTSVATAWKTLAPVNAARLAAGDRVLFAGGSVFTGPLTVGSAIVGTATKPVVYGSFGTGRATIDAGPARGDAISVKGATGVTFQHLNLTGAGLATGTAKPAVGLRLSNATTIKADRIETSGFQWAGIELSGSKFVTLTNINAHHNGYAGISSDGGYVQNTSGGQSESLMISDCQANDNSGNPYFPAREGGSYNGNGVVLFGIKHATVQYCEAARNGRAIPDQGGGGPVGIWAAHADDIVFQYDISHDNEDTTRGHGDGGGFDFDGGTTNSVIQYSYAYGNNCGGIYYNEYGSGEPWRDNVSRYNIVANNSRGGCHYELDGSAVNRFGASNGVFHHNFAYSDDPNTVVLQSGQGFPANTYAYYDNVVVATTADNLVANGDTSGNPFAGNAYLTLDGSTGINGYSDLASWRAETGQEVFNGKPVGLQGGDFKLRGPLAPPPKLIDPHRLGELSQYAYLTGSPLATAGIDVTQAGLTNVTRDFFGATASKTAIGLGGGKTPANPTAPLLANGDFANGIGNFSSFGAAIVDGQGLDSGRAAVISGNFGGVWQTLTGLAPNATYEVSAYLRSSTPAGGAYVYAKDYNGVGSLVEGEVTNTRALTRTSVSFTTGTGETTAEIGVFKKSGDNDGIAANLYVRRTK